MAGRRGADGRHQVGHQRVARLGVLVPQQGRVQRQHASPTTRSAWPRTPARPQHLRRHVGGPIIKDKLFYFGSWERYDDGAPRLTDTYACRRRGCATATSARWPRPTAATSGSTTRAPAAPAASAASSSPNYTIPARMSTRLAQVLLAIYPAAQTPTADLNSNLLLDDYQQFREIQVDRDNYDMKITWQRNAGALDLGQVLDAERRGRSTTSSSASTRAASATRGLRADGRPHLDAQPDARCSTATSASTARTRP